MDNDQNELRLKFGLDVENIAALLIAKFCLCHKKEISNLNNALLRWLDFRLRFIDPRPRKIILSKAFPKLLPTKVRKVADVLFGLIETGADLNPYQGKGLILHHDTSKKKREQRTDLLWADWNILHLHLCDKAIPKKMYFSERSDWLMFGMFDNDYFLCIDIRHHKDDNLFSDPELVGIVSRSWPEVISQYELKGVHGLETNLSAEEYGKLRKGGVSCPIAIDGKVYMGPGTGVTTASTASIVTSAEIDISRYLASLAEIVSNEETDFLPGWRINDKSPAITNLSLCITPNGLAIYDEKQDVAWALPNESAIPNYLVTLHSLLAPSWAVKRIFD